ncbi:MAG: hypothetical protein GVY21_07130, partial [Gammaproteobacteria bacterium]|nr:hypothetical protein [Gammaproteobacteria bacterium]
MKRSHLAALAAVEDGADIYSYWIAVALREIERDEPELIEITDPQVKCSPGHERQPYFGCICTPEGLDRLKWHRAKVT